MMVDDETSEGSVLAGRYRLGPIIGRGAMGVVRAADHLLLKERVAIKFMIDRRDNPEVVARFVQEARSARRIQSAHVIRVLDVAVRDDGVPYIVMEYLEGVDLAAHLVARRRLPSGEAVDYLLQACDAIGEAHGLGIIHRDLKPANLFLVHAVATEGAAPVVKVLDFGISKSTSLASRTLDATSTAVSPGLTLAKAILGSPAYMSPEQMDSARDVDLRTDIWSLGVTLFELVTGEVPFQGQSMLQVYKHALESTTWKAKLACHAPELRHVLERCLAPDREERFASVRELTDALGPHRSAPGHADAAGEPARRLPRGYVNGPETPRTGVREPATPGRSSGRVAKLLLPLAAGTLVVGVTALRRNGPREVPHSPPPDESHEVATLPARGPLVNALPPPGEAPDGSTGLDASVARTEASAPARSGAEPSVMGHRRPPSGPPPPSTRPLLPTGAAPAVPPSGTEGPSSPVPSREPSLPAPPVLRDTLDIFGPQK